MSEYKLSIVVPCYNSHETIARLLDSILTNDLNKDEYQVIICDDNSTDNFINIVKTYEKSMNITYCNTNTKIHCPGNTREAAIPYIKGEWTTFIDHDDFFEPRIFKTVFNIIEAKKIKYVLSTCFYMTSFDGKRINSERKGHDADTWLHGKFFNTENIFNKLNCHFKKDLKSHEDLYFNSLVKEKLYQIGEEIYYEEDFFTYNWVENFKSLSHTDIKEEENCVYIDLHLENYLTSQADPYLKHYKDIINDEKLQPNYFNIIITTLLFGYFYYQGHLNKRPNFADYEPNKKILHNFKNRIINECNVNEYYLIDYIYFNPQLYEKIRSMAIPGTGNFIEVQSFKDFILNI